MLKSAARNTLRALISGGREGMSVLGLQLEKLARYITFLTREARRDAWHAQAAPGGRNGWSPPPSAGVIYDVGANNGDDTAYYLSKGLKVVAIEANPDLAAKVASRFAEAIEASRLIVLNIAVTDDDRQSVDFYVHKDDQLSSAVTPIEGSADVKRISVAAQRLSAVIAAHGPAFYVKIDLEGLDALVLSDIFAHGLRPAYLSAEAHSIDVFFQLAAASYRKFKIVEGRYVHYPRYAGIYTSDPQAPFPHHASGPFGEDIPGGWLSLAEAFEYLSEHKPGWKDIHVAL